MNRHSPIANRPFPVPFSLFPFPQGLNLNSKHRRPRGTKLYRLFHQLLSAPAGALFHMCSAVTPTNSL